MTFWPEVVFQPEMLILQEIAFRPEMATSQNWTTNQLYFGQKLLFCQKLLFSQNWLFRQNWLFGQKWLFGRNGCSAETALRQKYFCQIWSGFLARNGFLAWYGFFQMNLPYFSKYWKVWLAFDGWKLSGLFFFIFLGLRSFTKKNASKSFKYSPKYCGSKKLLIIQIWYLL